MKTVKYLFIAALLLSAINACSHNDPARPQGSNLNFIVDSAAPIPSGLSSAESEQARLQTPIKAFVDWLDAFDSKQLEIEAMRTEKARLEAAGKDTAGMDAKIAGAEAALEDIKKRVEGFLKASPELQAVVDAREAVKRARQHAAEAGQSAAELADAQAELEAANAQLQEELDTAFAKEEAHARALELDQNCLRYWQDEQRAGATEMERLTAEQARITEEINRLQALGAEAKLEAIQAQQEELAEVMEKIVIRQDYQQCLDALVVAPQCLPELPENANEGRRRLELVHLCELVGQPMEVR